ncbi:Diguanylate cyclase (GGDEF)-like protein [Vibrio crassostreae]|uniref:diguanylate cyclase n=1 Tax=Vibrio crassostreae TaxID=246167 RepID=UPI000F463C37|nr:diguanylate cyclase [Vibrio crassostreae]NOH76723.1 GGDEF domain-containing protein [Vibrio crassostreae]ROR13860.1 diguanylate cyclase (GGDEF)-like protein [Vibrio crassostreae]TCN91252.1 diguanylate cyclase (GGDEF)-like protein [Vibrio crassostreae]CAK1946150.1 Diguanylate cyclase (GGDEF)-like protein [Vibrio crassostreae]CAK2313223.1 Diguanylate cyclase (GGDEF)-like protein [Vibrio crassostreae]
MIHSFFVTFLLFISFCSYSQVLPSDRDQNSSIYASHLSPTPNADWNALYLSTLNHSPERALNMLQTRYIGSTSYGDKLYLASLLYKYMSHRDQPFYGIASNDSDYQAIEAAFISALMKDGKGQYEEAQQGFLTLLAKMQSRSDLAGKALLKYQLCRSLNEQAKYHQANYYCSALQSDLYNIADPVLPKFGTYRVIANNHHFRSDYQAALDTYLSLINVFPQGHDISGVYNDVGNLLKELKQYEKSAEYLQEALTLRENASDLMKAQVHHSLADLNLNQEQSDLAIHHFQTARTLLSSSSHSYGIALTSLGLGKAYTQTKDYDLARTYLVESLSASSELSNDVIRINAYLAISDMFEEQKLPTEALNYAQQALGLAEQVARHKYIAQSLLQLSDINQSLNDYQQAFYFYQRYSSIQMEARDIDNRLALEALGLTHAKYEQELENSFLTHQTKLDRVQIEKMEHQRWMYNIVVILLLCAASFTVLVNKTVRAKAAIDGLTKAYSRTEIIRRIKRVKRCKGMEKQHVLVLLDLDKFKKINDEHGHPTGDRALIHISEKIRKHLVNGELFGRLGGEEFVIMLTDTTPAEVRERVEELHYAISSTVFLSESKKSLNVTASFAYLATSNALSDFDDLYSVLDQALYQAKSNGRNCIIDAYNEPIDLPEIIYSQPVCEPTQP